MKGLIRPRGRRRGPRRLAVPMFRSSARRGSDRWLHVMQLGVGDPRAVA